MRAFAKPSGLERLSLEARILYTAFAVFMLVGYGSSAWLYTDDALGVSAASARRYYLGEEPAPGALGDARAPEAATGPALELPPEARAEPTAEAEGVPLRFAKSPRQVMETFHFHVFSVPVCLLIVGHIFMMVGWPTRVKAWILGGGALATLLHVVTPPLVRFASPAFAALMYPSAVAMGLSWLLMTLWPVLEMWRPRRARTREDCAT